MIQNTRYPVPAQQKHSVKLPELRTAKHLNDSNRQQYQSVLQQIPALEYVNTQPSWHRLQTSLDQERL